MFGGYWGRLLFVDLSEERSWVWEPPQSLLTKFLGGKGVGLRILYDRALRADPLSPENLVLFMTGPVTATPVPTSGRSCAVFKSPLTLSAVDSHLGGFFGPAIKGAGFDGIAIQGKAKDPVFLHASAAGVEFYEAKDLWGKGILGTEAILKERFPKAEIAAIGPAGENLVRYACVGHRRFRQLGRGGAGAVLGAKNLKALVVEGSARPPLAREAEFRRLNRELAQVLRDHPMRKKREELGTTMWVRMAQEAGFLPTRNFRFGRFSGFEGITAEAMKRELAWKPSGCYNCSIRCAKLARWNGVELEGPEYETAAFLGANLEIGDARAVAQANLLCDDLGLDTISTGVVLGFAFAAAEKGILSLDGGFANPEKVLELIRKISYREGIGDLLAEGTRIAAERLGEEAAALAIQIGGMELSGVNPLGCASMSLSLATADFASHTRFWSATAEMQEALSMESVPAFVKEGQDEVAARNSLSVCDFLPFGFDRLAPILNAITGMDLSSSDLMTSGERIENLHRLFNLACGRKKDELPRRFLAEEHVAGLFRGRKMTEEEFRKWLLEYYRLRGWDENGVPTPERLACLELA